MSLPPFEMVVLEHGFVVLRVCRAVLPMADADDAWSTTFLAALEAYPRLAPDSNIRGWLVTIAHRKAIDVVRAASRAPLPLGQDFDRVAPIEGFDPFDSFGSFTAVVEEDLQLWEAVRALPTKQRHAVAYHHVAGLPYVEVGNLLGCTTDAARRRAADGIAALRRTIIRKPIEP